MRFQLDHDWQGNMSTPRARVGEAVKTQLLLLLCGIWIVLGLVGHAPWKPLETTGISIVKTIVDGGSLIAPLANGESSLDLPPLYYLSAATSAALLSPILALHDGARLINIFWLSILLLMIGMTGRELWGRGVGRHATFITIGTIGLIVSAHSLGAEVAGLTSLSCGFYALALYKRRPWRASGLLGLALGLGFLSYGFMPFIILMSTTLSLGLLFKAWRTISFAKVIVTATLIATPLIASWLFMFHHEQPLLFSKWWQMNLNMFHYHNHQYFLKILIWYAWPAFPLALWGLWRYRQQLLSKPKFQLIISFFICSIICLGFGAIAKDVSALPLLIPFVALAAGSIEHLKRGAASALNWFGIMLFGLIGFLIWLGWVAMITGYPTKIKERLQFLSGAYNTSFNLLIFLVAMAISIIWFLVCVRAKQTNRSTVSNWAVGMTFGWSLLMSLWLPLLDSAKSYQPLFFSLHKAIPKHYNCINSLHVAQPQRLLVNYYTDVTLKPVTSLQQLSCDLYLIQTTKGTIRAYPEQGAKLIWKGRRAADKKESFSLYQDKR
ncbi:MAG: hypothetical protein RL063_312 [Pseudomonadota bacterium]